MEEQSGLDILAVSISGAYPQRHPEMKPVKSIPQNPLIRG
jgi:hypothetical protein